MGSKKTKTTSEQTATTTPNVPDFYKNPAQQYFGLVDNLIDKPATSLVTPNNALQDSVYQQAGALPAPDLSNAISLVSNLANAPKPGTLNMKGQTNAYQTPKPVQTATFTPAELQTPAAQIYASNPGNVDVASVGQIGPRNIAQAGVASLPQAVQAQAASIGPTSGAVANLADLEDLKQAQSYSLLDSLANYLNPATDAYVTNTLASFDDDAGRKEAAYRAQAAKAKAFGGSRFAIGEAQLQSDLARERGGLESGLRYQAFNDATDLSDRDAARKQQASVFNAGQYNDRGNLNAQLGTDASITNANNSSRQAIAAAELANQVALANAAAQNQFGLAGFNAQNSANLFNTGALNDAFSQQFGFDSTAALQNAKMQNDANQLAYTTSANTDMFNAGQGNNMSQFNTAQANDMSRYNAGLANDTSRFNANATNDMTQFDRNLNLAQGNQQLNAASLLGSLAAQQQGMQLNTLGFQNTIGNQQYARDNAANLAPYTQASVIQDLLNPSIPGLFTGQTVNSQGTSTSKQSGGLLGGVLGIGSLFEPIKLNI